MKRDDDESLSDMPLQITVEGLGLKIYHSIFGDVRIIKHPILEPTERQLTLSRLLGRPPEDFIP